uniref:Glutamate synthase domain 2 n=1 Tax=uncultured Chloroflexi bacterium HF0200_06I16 TaxID=710735 RepID=E0XTY2_9CHLR|nr:glutamate synthase domain 2 [uncultured Chloroflexi bacterium HF0200_06I16]
MDPLKELAKNGLYSLEQEHDACGVGVVANIDGHKTNQIIEEGVQVLINLGHRGAAGRDPETGDGAGMLIQMPAKLFEREAHSLGIDLPPAGRYGVGMVFMPPEAEAECRDFIRNAVEAEGLGILGWRDVPVDRAKIGEDAREVCPFIAQVFIGPKSDAPNTSQLERKLFVVRKVLESTITELGLTEEQTDSFYICSMSCNTIVYKGLLMAHQIAEFYKDLSDPDVVSAFALVHSRFSTNTLGSWRLAHPYRYLAHNGEINTLRGNVNWMHAREAQFESPLFGDDVAKITPVTKLGDSDTASLDNALELLQMSGRDLDHALLMLIPEAWDQHETMSQEKKDFYEYHSSLMEPWDGPAMIVASDGNNICALLDRNGLRPFRYLVTNDDKLVMASETGVLDVPPSDVKLKGRLQPGRMFLVSLEQGRIIDDDELKSSLARKNNYGQWLKDNKITLKDLPAVTAPPALDARELVSLQQAFGYTIEEIRMLTSVMAENGTEAIGSMGNDTPLAVLSDQNQILYHYFKQLFAQVTNPPLDAIREELVTSIGAFIGTEQNLFEETPEHCRQLRLASPVISDAELAQIKALDEPGLRSCVLAALYDRESGDGALKRALDDLRIRASKAIEDGFSIIVLSDRGADSRWVPIPSLLTVSAVHHHLIREGKRTKAGLVMESGDAREVHHFALLIGYGAGAVNPYLALATVNDLAENGQINGIDSECAQKNFIKANEKGVLKVMSKMGISTVQSYRGAQIFEAIGLNQELVDEYFTWTPSRVGGIGLDGLERETSDRHRRAFVSQDITANTDLDMGGAYQWRRGGEHHQWNPEIIGKLQHASRTNNWSAYKEFSRRSDDETRRLSNLRGLLNFKDDLTPVPIEEVEQASEIVKRFATGAASLGSISREAHEAMAIAMNRIGARSNTGEGGEDYLRYFLDENGDSRSSAIKQVASGRFGVTANYLINATDLQIKMAQGAKPGEGGQLPGHKVDEYIGSVRKTTPGVELISPPPHHDIYSIEDLAQLIHDLKNINPVARIHVKLVAEVGVGTIAAGVAKGHGDVVLISGHDGGTGASPESSIKHAGIPWELGVAETQQVLVANGLRSRIVLQTDGQLKTGRDAVIATLLGAEEFGFATSALVVSGCIMLRKCHMNTCSVGIATQDPELRKQFAGKPEHLVSYFTFVAEEMREIMAELGFRTVAEMIGRTDVLDYQDANDHWKSQGMDLSRLLHRQESNDPGEPVYCVREQDHGLDKALDNELIAQAQPALDSRSKVNIELPIDNSNRTVGAMLSGKIAKEYGEDGLPDGTITINLTGSAGQSFGAFLARGININLNGDTNDYMGKGMSGGRIVVTPHPDSRFAPEDNIIIGNVAMYGATGGDVFISGMAGERFCVRNSGAKTVVEAVGDHGCEYMTGGIAVVLGPTGRNFAAGMSGGIAFVYDKEDRFAISFNDGMADMETVTDPDDIKVLKGLIEDHKKYTGSTPASEILRDWDVALKKFKKIMPRDYRRVLEERKRRLEDGSERELEVANNG